MKATLNPTEKIVELDGVPARVWEGETESGIKVHAFITRIAVSKDEDASQFEEELEEHDPLSAEIESYPARLIL